MATATNDSDSTIKGKQAFDQQNNVAGDGVIDMSMVENVLLIWLDKNIDNQNIECSQIIAQLRSTINTTKTFTDPDQCVDFLTDICDEKVCMIISGELCQKLVPLIHSIAHLQSIFIFCTDKTQFEQWVKNWAKIRGIFTEITDIHKALKQTAEDCEQNAVPISLISTDGDIANKKLDQLDPSFMYTQILKEILLTIEFEQKHRTDFFDYCGKQFEGNNKQLQNVKRLKGEYSDKTPIWWYTRESFLYPMVNRALRTMDPDLMIKVGFFIVDLHRQIEKLYQKQFGGNDVTRNLTVYRGQGMAKADFEKMMKNNGGLLSFNSFLSTSRDCNVSRSFVNRAMQNPDIIGVIFIMTIDPTQSTTPFTDITEASSFGHKENEVLFSMHTVFRIGDIKPVGKNHRLFQVALTITSKSDNDLERLMNRIREETFPDSSGWYRLSLLLSKMGHPEIAQPICNTLFKQSTSHSTKALLYGRFGKNKYQLGEYQEAMAYYTREQEIIATAPPQNHPDLASSHGNIGLVYFKMGDYPKALSSYDKALTIQKQSLPPNHPDLASSHGNIGLVYSHMGDYPKALSSFDETLTIQRQSLPPNHPALASSYDNIGSVYFKMGDYPKALSSYDEALTIQRQSLPPNHPDLASSHGNIGLVYSHMGDYPKALSSYDETLTIQRQSLPPNHPDLASSHNNIGSVYFKMGDYLKALSSYDKALTIQRQSLPPNHPDLASSHGNIGLVYSKMDDYPKAISSYDKALTIQQQSLPPNHPQLASSHGNIGLMYFKMGDYLKALSSYDKALTIQKQSLPPNHPDLASSHNNIGSVYSKMGDYPKALSSYDRALTIKKQSLPPNHPDLASSHGNIGLVYSNMGDYPKALSSYDKAFTIQKQSLPPNHPDLASSHNNIGSVYCKMGDYPKALSSYDKALSIRQESLPPNHPDLASSHNNISLVYSNMDDYPKALSSYDKALTIKKQSLPPNHPDLARAYCRMGLLHECLKNYSKAYEFLQYAVNIGQQGFPPHHPDLQQYQKKLADVKKKL